MQRNDNNNNNKSLAVLDRFCNQEVTLRKILSFDYSLLLTQIQCKFGHYHIWDQIVPHLYLGQIPTRKKARELTALIPHLALVISLVEPYEFDRKTLSGKKMQTPLDWAKMGVAHYLINAPDSTADIPIENIKKAIELIDYYIEQGLDVYVHCKAGMGRSATLVAAYLLVKYHCKFNDSLDDIHAFLKTKRKQVNLKDSHYQKLIEAKEKCTKKKERPKDLDLGASNPNANHDDLLARLNTYLATHKAKKALSQLISIKMLMIYASQHRNTVCESEIKIFIDKINNAQDAEWYKEILSQTSQLHRLAAVQHSYLLFKTSPFRNLIPLVQQLKVELAEHFSQTLCCDKKFFMELDWSSSKSPNIVLR